MILKIFFIEAKRSLKMTLTLILCSILFGFTLTSMLGLKNYIEALFTPVQWGANLVIAPKGVSLEGIHRSVLRGEPEGLIPIALFETLQSQILEEQALRHRPSPSLKVLGLIPYQDHDGKIQVAYLGDKESFFSASPDPSLWNQISFKPWVSTSSEFLNRPGYQTPEWGSRVLMGILAKGDSGPIERLKELIDRKTIAQGFRVTVGQTDADHRVDQLGKSLYALVALISGCLIPGLFLAMLILRERRFLIFDVMNELGWKSTSSTQLMLLQSLFLILGPAILGIIFGIVLTPLIQQLIKFS